MGTVYLSEKDMEKLSGRKLLKESKFKSQKCQVNGITFHSQWEGRHYQELLLLERQGEISHLQLQVPFELIPAQREPDTVGPRGGIRRGRCLEQSVVYFADFVYLNRSGERIVEDTKGVRTADYVIKRKLMLYIHHIKIREVRENESKRQSSRETGSGPGL